MTSGESLADAAKAMNLAYREFGPFTRVNPPLTDPMVVGTAFGLDVGQRSGLLDTPEGMYVMQVLEHTKADSAKFVKELDEYRSKMIDLARQDRIRGYMGALRESAKIVDNRAKLHSSNSSRPRRLSSLRSSDRGRLLREPLRLAGGRLRLRSSRSGWRGCRFRWSSFPMIASWVSVRLRLNSRMPFPMEAPISGSRLAPKRSNTTSRMIMISVKPRLPTGTP